MKYKFVGLVPTPTECGFGIPIYSDGIKNYHHELDDNFIITSFHEVQEDQQKQIKKAFGGIYSQALFGIGDKGLLVWTHTKTKDILVGPKEEIAQCKDFMISISGKHCREEIENFF